MPYTFDKYIEKQKEKLNGEILEKIREKDKKESDEKKIASAAKEVAEGKMSLEAYMKL